MNAPVLVNHRAIYIASHGSRKLAVSPPMSHPSVTGAVSVPLPVASALTLLCLLLLSPLSLAGSSSLPALSSYANSISLDPKYDLYWTADTSASPDKVSFAVRVQTKGYVAFGISEVGGMVGTGEAYCRNHDVAYK